MSFDVLTFVAGAVTAVCAEPLRRWIFRPTLKLEFANTEHFVTKTPERINSQVFNACYVRVRATNTSYFLAKDCLAFLIKIEKQIQPGRWEPTEYCESQQLRWSASLDGYGAVDLPHDVSQFVDVVSTIESEASFRPHISVPLYRHDRLFASPGTYRFSILVTGDNVKRDIIRLSFKWNGQWDKIDVATA